MKMSRLSYIAFIHKAMLVSTGKTGQAEHLSPWAFANLLLPGGLSIGIFRFFSLR